MSSGAAPGLQPDIIVRHPGGLPVAVRDRIHPQLTRLSRTRGKRPREDVAANRRQNRTGPRCAHSEHSGRGKPEMISKQRSREQSWNSVSSRETPKTLIVGQRADGSPEQSTILPHSSSFAALSENRVAQGMQILENGIDQAAGKTARRLHRRTGHARGHRWRVTSEGRGTDLADGDGHSCKCAHFPFCRPPAPMTSTHSTSFEMSGDVFPRGGF